MISPDPIDPLLAVAGALEGDRDAAAWLFREIAPVVRVVAWRMCQDPEDRREAEQHVYEVLFSRALRLYRGGSLRSFARAVAHNAIATRQRRAAWHTRLRSQPVSNEDQDPLDSVASEDPSPEDRVRARELEEKIEQILGTLTAQQAAILVLWLFHHLQPTEIADIIGTSPEVIRTTLKRLRRGPLQAIFAEPPASVEET